MFAVYSTEEGFINTKEAYLNLEKAIQRGVTMFDVFHKYFSENYDDLS